jgi:hypothetical protein
MLITLHVSVPASSHLEFCTFRAALPYRRSGIAAVPQNVVAAKGAMPDPTSLYPSRADRAEHYAGSVPDAVSLLVSHLWASVSGTVHVLAYGLDAFLSPTWTGLLAGLRHAQMHQRQGPGQCAHGQDCGISCTWKGAEVYSSSPQENRLQDAALWRYCRPHRHGVWWEIRMSHLWR